MDEQLQEFWAVTTSGSLWRVSDQGNESGNPSLEKLASIGKGEQRIKVGERLTGHKYVGITPNLGLQLYTSTGERRTAFMTNTNYWGGYTSSIVGLFLRKEGAEICLSAQDLQPWDNRWLKETAETLARIGDDHPVFIVGPGLPLDLSLAYQTLNELIRAYQSGKIPEEYYESACQKLSQPNVDSVALR